MSDQSIFERIAVLRPAEAGRTRELVGPAERKQLLESITATETPGAKPLATGGRRRTWMIAASMTAVAAGVCVVLVASGVLRPHIVSHDQLTQEGKAGHDATYSPAQSVAALDKAAHDVLHTTWTPGNGIQWEDWALVDGSKDHSTNFQLNGRIISDIVLVSTPDTQSATVVSYPDHAWWTWSKRVDPDPCRGIPQCFPVSGLRDGIKKELGSGALKVLGDGGTIDGQSTIKLSGSLPPVAGDNTEKQPVTLWVSTSSYLPIRISTGNRDGSVSQSDYTWLPPTQDNLDHLQVAIPHGFFHSPKPIG